MIEPPAGMSGSAARGRGVRGDCRDPSSDGSRGGFENFLPPARDVDVGAFGREPLGHRPAEARSSPGNQRDLAGETHPCLPFSCMKWRLQPKTYARPDIGAKSCYVCST